MSYQKVYISSVVIIQPDTTGCLMRLQTKLYLYSSITLLVVVAYFFLAGFIIINQLSYQASIRAMDMECEKITDSISEMDRILEATGLASLKSYQNEMGSEVRSRYNHYSMGDTGILAIYSPSGEEVVCSGAVSKIQMPVKSAFSDRNVLEYKDMPTGRKMTLVQRETKSGWRIVLALDNQEIYRKRNLYIRIASAASIFVILFGMSIAYLFARKLSSQIAQMLDMIRFVASGNLNEKIHLKPFCKEYEELQNGINFMVENIRLRELERDKAEEEARRNQKLESIGILAGGIAHDFNNLLTAVRGNLQLAQLFNNNPDAKQCLGDCEKATIRAMSLTKQLLTFAKGGVPLKSTASIAEILENNCTFVLRGTKSKCEFDIDPTLYPVDIDYGQIGQAIDNIVINANQAMPGGGIIKIKAININLPEGDTLLGLNPGRYVKITIADQGVGIPKENLSKIFDPFFTTKATGSGLGLSTSYTIIKKHGGHLTVNSTPGLGTVFYIYLPASQNTAQRDENQVQRENKYISGGKILIMDDQESIRSLLGKMLSMMNCRCEFADTGEAAIEKYRDAKAKEDPFDVIFMDLTIPGGMGGKDTLAALMRIDPNVLAVVASGYSNDPVMSEYAKFGFKARLNKPFKMQELTLLMRQLMAQKKLSDRAAKRTSRLADLKVNKSQFDTAPYNIGGAKKD